ncbi:MAG: CDP-diacylglycerol--serine O-phosphatidyltransferase, partial [Muribaculaceae bacterium]|nr:CDP-diacylglycerol--serine O-phosphatidyltransferase [Muribaculaceae bacterium]
MSILRRNIPNLITCVNILSGCVAIVFAFNFTEVYGGLEGWRWACLAIGIAAVADFFDGFTARLLHAYSELGKQLDSLSDLVSFGVAPAMLIFNLIASHPESPLWLPWLTLFIPVCGALRLARFNIDTRQTTSFIGLPIPANAIFWIGWAALAADGFAWTLNTWIAAAVILIEGWSMISQMHLFSLKFKNYGWKGNQRRWILVIVSIALIATLGLSAFFPIICIY